MTRMRRKMKKMKKKRERKRVSNSQKGDVKIIQLQALIESLTRLI